MRYLKKINYIQLIVFSLIGCDSAKQKFPQINFTKDTFDFGQINRGDSVTAIYSFTNKGFEKLIVKKIGTSCGCTNAYSSKDTVDPMEEARIHATYYSTKDSGKILKTIIVESNTNPVLHVLYIAGKVNP
jgi:hypothetical protein